MKHEPNIQPTIQAIGTVVKLCPPQTRFANERLAEINLLAPNQDNIPVIVDGDSLVAGALLIAGHLDIGAKDILVTDMGHLSPADKQAYAAAYYRDLAGRGVPVTLINNLREELGAQGYLREAVTLAEIDRGQHLLRHEPSPPAARGKKSKKERDPC